MVDLAGPDVGEDRRRYDQFRQTRAAVPLDEVKAWVASWGSDDELPVRSLAGSVLLSQDAVEDLERLRAFLNHANPEAAKRASALIWATVEKLQNSGAGHADR